jgi:putative transposase
MLLGVVVHPADIQDRDGARLLLNKLAGRFRELRLIWADGGYAGQLVDWVREHTGWELEIVRRPSGKREFAVLPRRWVVERTLAWLGRCRRLSKDYECLVSSSEAWIQIAMIQLMLRRLAPS